MLGNVAEESLDDARKALAGMKRGRESDEVGITSAECAERYASVAAEDSRAWLDGKVRLVERRGRDGGLFSVACPLWVADRQRMVGSLGNGVPAWADEACSGEEAMSKAREFEAPRLVTQAEDGEKIFEAEIPIVVSKEGRAFARAMGSREHGRPRAAAAACGEFSDVAARVASEPRPREVSDEGMLAMTAAQFSVPFPVEAGNRSALVAARAAMEFWETEKENWVPSLGPSRIDSMDQSGASILID